MRVVLRLTKYAFRHKWYLVGAYATMVASTLSAMVIPRILGDAIDEAPRQRPPEPPPRAGGHDSASQSP